jgi:general secretion pathway protein K
MEHIDQDGGSPRVRIEKSERGVALLLAVFVITLATILVFELGKRARYDQVVSRSFSEGIQGDYVLKSGLSFARFVLELPREEGVSEDWLGQPWALLEAATQLQIEGVVGDPRILIVDDDGKVDLNWLVQRRRTGAGAPARGAGEFWRDTLTELFHQAGFEREQFDPRDYRTKGDIAFDAPTQVAAIIDWIDKDTLPYSSPGFQGDGLESNGNLKPFFANRKFRSIGELLTVPGMTLERLQRISPFVRVSNSSSAPGKINVNTAPAALLLAMGLPESDVNELDQERRSFAIKSGMLSSLALGDNELKNYLKVNSSAFSIYVRIRMPSSTRWLRATVKTSATGITRKTSVEEIETY